MKKLLIALTAVLAFGSGVADAVDQRDQAERVSPNITYYFSEFAKLRLQYNYTHFAESSDEQAIWAQLEFMIGAHAAHKF